MDGGDSQKDNDDYWEISLTDKGTFGGPGYQRRMVMTQGGLVLWRMTQDSVFGPYAVTTEGAHKVLACNMSIVEALRWIAGKVSSQDRWVMMRISEVEEWALDRFLGRVDEESEA